MAIIIEPLTGAELKAALPSLAELRIAVFRAYPYLYDGTLAYEQDYLARFAAADGAIVVAARDAGRIIGVATGAPLGGHTASFVPLFAKHGIDPDTIFYFGESVLLPPYRGQGFGHAFFDHREAHARRCPGANGPFTRTAFCGVIRPSDHPAKPADYRPLDAFWMKRGYSKIDGLIGTYSWRDIGETTDTAKPMQFWFKDL